MALLCQLPTPLWPAMPGPTSLTSCWRQQALRPSQPPIPSAVFPRQPPPSRWIWGPFSPSASTITVAPSAIPLGGQAIVTLTAKDAAGNLQPGGGSPNFVMGTTGTGFGNFTNFVDHNNGIYTATFISTVSGSNTITGSLNGQNITSTPPSITINPATKFDHFQSKHHQRDSRQHGFLFHYGRGQQ